MKVINQYKPVSAKKLADSVLSQKLAVKSVFLPEVLWQIHVMEVRKE